jgi:hypothetical protein
LALNNSEAVTATTMEFSEGHNFTRDEVMSMIEGRKSKEGEVGAEIFSSIFAVQFYL